MSDRTTTLGIAVDADPSRSAVAWGAIFAGATAAAAITFALIVLGAGLGLSLVSPWYEANASVATVAASTIIWLVVTQWASSGIGGYLTGRLRRSWEAGTVSDEVFFRDTAHGFVAWCVSTLLVATLATSALSGVLGTGAQIAGQAVSGAASGATQEIAGETTDPSAYFVDSLFRASPAAPAATQQDPAAVTAEATRILVRGVAADTFPAEDRTYLATVVAQRAGLSQADAEARVDAVVQSMNDAKVEAQRIADEARQGAITLSIVTFISLLIGAFIASVAAVLGGRQRDTLVIR